MATTGARLRLAAAAMILGGALAACAPDIVERKEPGVGPLGNVAEQRMPAIPGFGEVAVVCEMPRAALGKRIDQRPERGRAQWELYDTAPGSTDLRQFHITGFADGCARRVTASLVMFGSVELYELVNFTGLGVEGETGATDRAYRQIRAGQCGSDSRPCAEGPLKRLTRSTAFLTAFPRKGNPRNLEILVHDGQVAATAVK